MRGIERGPVPGSSRGFNELIPQHLLKPFDQKELEVGHAGLGCGGCCVRGGPCLGQAADEAAQSHEHGGRRGWEAGTGVGDREGVRKPEQGWPRPVVHVVAGSQFSRGPSVRVFMASPDLETSSIERMWL